MHGTERDDAGLDRVVAAVRALRNLAMNDGLPCLDFIDVKVVLVDPAGPQRAHFGAGEARGPDRALRAAEAALADLRRHVAETCGTAAPHERRAAAGD